ncbi:MAG: disulfide bond formation protein B [Pseudomonadota bacterium]
MFAAPLHHNHALLALGLACVMAAVVGAALVFEHGFGYVPCALCLLQREPYYVGVPFAGLAALAAWVQWPQCVTRGALLIVGLLMAYGVLLSAFHAGVEWSWWTGPDDCATSSTAGVVTQADTLLGALDTVKPPSCDEAAGRVLGLSFAGWNVVASAVFAWAAFRLTAMRGAEV